MRTCVWSEALDFNMSETFIPTFSNTDAHHVSARGNFSQVAISCAQVCPLEIVASLSKSNISHGISPLCLVGFVQEKL